MADATAQPTSAPERVGAARLAHPRLLRARQFYFCLVAALVLATLLANFIQHRGQLASNVSTWLFVATFAVGVANLRAGLLCAVVLLTVTPALHQQLNALAGFRLTAWSHPGTEAMLGFFAAWLVRGRPLSSLEPVFRRAPSGPMLLLHAWIALSSIVAVTRNLWQSASEFHLPGFVMNVRLLRTINWRDDYFPLQDLFFYSVALCLILAVWSLLLRDGREKNPLPALVACVLTGASANAVFAVWQQMTGAGWIADAIDRSINAFWPDLHSFGAFMAVAALLGYASFACRTRATAFRSFAALAAVLSLVALFLSTSRIPVFVLAVLAAAWGVWRARTLTGWRRAAAALFAVAAVLSLHALLMQGYRGFSYESLSPVLKGFHAGNWNAMLGYRPELWAAAARMYLEFPFFGLGQGTFYRLGGIPAFGGSDLLTTLGGEHAHNYFLQSFVELGPIGLGLISLACLPIVRRVGSANARSIALAGLAGVLIGNVYAHSLLTRELLLLTAMLAALYLWEAEQLVPSSMRAPSSNGHRWVLAGLGVLGLLALVDAATSLQRFPFEYAQRCHEPRQWSDGWTSGLQRHPVPGAARRVEILVSWPRRDVDRRSLEIEAAVSSADGAVIAKVVLSAVRPGLRLEQVLLELPPGTGSRLVTVKASHCYVPLNLGHQDDSRTLGMRVPLIRFLDESGSAVPGIE